MSHGRGEPGPRPDVVNFVAVQGLQAPKKPQIATGALARPKPDVANKALVSIGRGGAI